MNDFETVGIIVAIVLVVYYLLLFLTKKWSRIPYWLRGGLIVGAITLASAFLLYSCDSLINATVHDISGESVGFVCLPFALISPMLPFETIVYLNPISYGLPTISLPIISVIFWFIIGSCIGGIVQYIKSRKIKIA